LLPSPRNEYNDTKLNPISPRNKSPPKSPKYTKKQLESIPKKFDYEQQQKLPDGYNRNLPDVQNNKDFTLTKNDTKLNPISPRNKSPPKSPKYIKKQLESIPKNFDYEQPNIFFNGYNRNLPDVQNNTDFTLTKNDIKLNPISPINKSPNIFFNGYNRNLSYVRHSDGDFALTKVDDFDNEQPKKLPDGYNRNLTDNEIEKLFIFIKEKIKYYRNSYNSSSKSYSFSNNNYLNITNFFRGSTANKKHLKLIKIIEKVKEKAIEKKIIIKNDTQLTTILVTVLDKLFNFDPIFNEINDENVNYIKNLQIFYLSFNKLYNLPESIGNLVKLESLLLCDVGLHNLPESIGNLNQLKHLDLSYNKLTNLPESIGNLVKLESLKLSEVGLDNLPESIGNLNQLKYLDLSHNKLTNLPESIKKLSNTKILLTGNPVDLKLKAIKTGNIFSFANNSNTTKILPIGGRKSIRKKNKTFKKKNYSKKSRSK